MDSDDESEYGGATQAPLWDDSDDSDDVAPPQQITNVYLAIEYNAGGSSPVRDRKSVPPGKSSLGRHKKRDIKLASNTVSSSHAEIEVGLNCVTLRHVGENSKTMIRPMGGSGGRPFPIAVGQGFNMKSGQGFTMGDVSCVISFDDDSLTQSSARRESMEPPPPRSEVSTEPPTERMLDVDHMDTQRTESLGSGSEGDTQPLTMGASPAQQSPAAETVGEEAAAAAADEAADIVVASSQPDAEADFGDLGATQTCALVADSDDEFGDDAPPPAELAEPAASSAAAELTQPSGLGCTPDAEAAGAAAAASSEVLVPDSPTPPSAAVRDEARLSQASRQHSLSQTSRASSQKRPPSPNFDDDDDDEDDTTLAMAGSPIESPAVPGIDESQGFAVSPTQPERSAPSSSAAESPPAAGKPDSAPESAGHPSIDEEPTQAHLGDDDEATGTGGRSGDLLRASAGSLKARDSYNSMNDGATQAYQEDPPSPADSAGTQPFSRTNSFADESLNEDEMAVDFGATQGFELPSDDDEQPAHEDDSSTNEEQQAAASLPPTPETQRPDTDEPTPHSAPTLGLQQEAEAEVTPHSAPTQAQEEDEESPAVFPPSPAAAATSQDEDEDDDEDDDEASTLQLRMSLSQMENQGGGTQDESVVLPSPAAVTPHSAGTQGMDDAVEDSPASPAMVVLPSTPANGQDMQAGDEEADGMDSPAVAILPTQQDISPAPTPHSAATQGQDDDEDTEDEAPASPTLLPSPAPMETQGMDSTATVSPAALDLPSQTSPAVTPHSAATQGQNDESPETIPFAAVDLATQGHAESTQSPATTNPDGAAAAAGSERRASTDLDPDMTQGFESDFDDEDGNASDDSDILMSDAKVSRQALARKNSAATAEATQSSHVTMVPETQQEEPAAAPVVVSAAGRPLADDAGSDTAGEEDDDEGDDMDGGFVVLPTQGTTSGLQRNSSAAGDSSEQILLQSSAREMDAADEKKSSPVVEVADTQGIVENTQASADQEETLAETVAVRLAPRDPDQENGTQGASASAAPASAGFSRREAEADVKEFFQASQSPNKAEKPAAAAASQDEGATQAHADASESSMPTSPAARPVAPVMISPDATQPFSRSHSAPMSPAGASVAAEDTEATQAHADASESSMPTSPALRVAPAASSPNATQPFSGSHSPPQQDEAAAASVDDAADEDEEEVEEEQEDDEEEDPTEEPKAAAPARRSSRRASAAPADEEEKCDEDGEEEAGGRSSRRSSRRGPSSASAASEPAPAPASKPAAAADDGEDEELAKGDTVMALYAGDGTNYPAVVSKVNRSKGKISSYQVKWDDGATKFRTVKSDQISALEEDDVLFSLSQPPAIDQIVSHEDDEDESDEEEEEAAKVEQQQPDLALEAPEEQEEVDSAEEAEEEEEAEEAEEDEPRARPTRSSRRTAGGANEESDASNATGKQTKLTPALRRTRATGGGKTAKKAAVVAVEVEEEGKENSETAIQPRRTRRKRGDDDDATDESAQPAKAAKVSKTAAKAAEPKKEESEAQPRGRATRGRAAATASSDPKPVAAKRSTRGTRSEAKDEEVKAAEEEPEKEDEEEEEEEEAAADPPAKRKKGAAVAAAANKAAAALAKKVAACQPKPRAATKRKQTCDDDDDDTDAVEEAEVSRPKRRRGAAAADTAAAAAAAAAATEPEEPASRVPSQRSSQRSSGRSSASAAAATAPAAAAAAPAIVRAAVCSALGRGKRPVVVVFTGFDRKKAEDFAGIVEQLGGRVSTLPSDCTHVIFESNKVAKTEKSLVALSRGCIFTTIKWLTESQKAKKWQNSTQFIVRDKSLERELGFELPVSIARAQHSSSAGAGLFAGKEVFATKTVGRGNHDAVARIVETAGASFSRRALGKNRGGGGMEKIVITDPADAAEISRLKDNGHVVYEWLEITTSLLTQELRF